jgi:integrase
MGVYLKGKDYYIDYYVNGRRKREKVGASKKLADLALEKRHLEVAEGKFLDIDRTERVKFEVFAKEFFTLHSKATKKSWHSDISLINILNKYFGDRYLDEITTHMVDNYKMRRIKEAAPATVNRGLALLKCMFNKAIEWEKVKENPVRRVKLFKEDNKRLRFLEKEEMEALISNCCRHLKPIVIVALHTGMRRGELLHLKWHDVDFKRDIIYLINTKNSEKREVPMNDIVKTALIKVHKHPRCPYIFCNRNGKPFGDIKKSFCTALRKSGIIGFHFHDLRHTFASQLVMAGVDLNTVRELLGHKTLDMTLRYSHLSQDHKKRAVDVLAGRMDTIWPPEPIAETKSQDAVIASV